MLSLRLFTPKASAFKRNARRKPIKQNEQLTFFLKSFSQADKRFHYAVLLNDRVVLRGACLFILSFCLATGRAGENF
jgi:hypothetical protein